MDSHSIHNVERAHTDTVMECVLCWMLCWIPTAIHSNSYTDNTLTHRPLYINSMHPSRT